MQSSSSPMRFPKFESALSTLFGANLTAARVSGPIYSGRWILSGLAQALDVACLLHTVFGIRGGRSQAALNQLFERHSDSLMERTTNRLSPWGTFAASGSPCFWRQLTLVGLAYLASTVRQLRDDRGGGICVWDLRFPVHH